MNNVYFNKSDKLHTGNRAGMIRSYRTVRTLGETLLSILDLFLFALDRLLDTLIRPTVCRVIRGISAITCIVAFLCLIAAVESSALSFVAACPIAVLLFALEILCLHGN